MKYARHSFGILACSLIITFSAEWLVQPYQIMITFISCKDHTYQYISTPERKCCFCLFTLLHVITCGQKRCKFCKDIKQAVHNYYCIYLCFSLWNYFVHRFFLQSDHNNSLYILLQCDRICQISHLKSKIKLHFKNGGGKKEPARPNRTLTLHTYT